MNKESKIYVAGHTGLVGSAIVRKLEECGYKNLVLRTHGELELTDQAATEAFFATEQPEFVFVAAGLVGGIKANSESPADFFFENMMIANNVIWSAYRNGVKKLLYLGSACMYPKECSQPMKEDQILTALPETTNEGYALAKIAGCRLCSYMKKQYNVDFISAVPANAYGINDCFDPIKSHVIPALIMKYHNAKVNNQPFVELWGTGKAMREFLNTEDIADASLFLMETYNGIETINIGSNSEVSILELSKMIKAIVGYEGEIVTDPTKPDGMMRRLLDSKRINEMGWKAQIGLYEGLTEVYKWYLQNQ